MARTSTGHGVPGPRFACCPLHLSSGNLKKVSDLYLKVGGLFLEKGRINAKALGWGTFEKATESPCNWSWGWDGMSLGVGEISRWRTGHVMPVIPRSAGTWLLFLRSFPWPQWEGTVEKETRATAGMWYQPRQQSTQRGRWIQGTCQEKNHRARLLTSYGRKEGMIKYVLLMQLLPIVNWKVLKLYTLWRLLQ